MGCQQFFDTLITIVDEIQLHGRPHSLCNWDKRSFGHNTSGANLVSETNPPSQRKAFASERENMSVLLCCSSSGQKLPTLSIFITKRVMDNWLEKGEIDAIAAAASARH